MNIILLFFKTEELWDFTFYITLRYSY